MTSMLRHLALLVCVVGCGASADKAGPDEPGDRAGDRAADRARIGASIADAPPCPPPPTGLGGTIAARWVEQCAQVGRTAADNVETAMNQAERVRDVVWLTCLREKHRTIESLRRRISAERIALAGLGGERAIARVRTMCLRIHLLVAEARDCV